MHSTCDVNVTSRYSGRLWNKVWKFKSSVYSHRTCRQSIKLPNLCIIIRMDHYSLPSEVIGIRHLCHWSIGYGGRVEETGGNKNTCSPLTSIMQPKYNIYICIYALYITIPSPTRSLTTLIVLFKILLSSLTHWGRVTQKCVSKLSIIGSNNGLSPNRRQAIIWTNAGIWLIGPLGTNFNEILIGIQTFSFKKTQLNMSSEKWRPFCFGLNVLKYNGWPINCTGLVIVKWSWKRYLMISVSLKPGEYTHVLETNVDF